MTLKAIGKTKATLISGEGDLLAYSNGNGVVKESDLLGNQSVGIEMQQDAVALATLAADTAPVTTGFSIDDEECDLDRPTVGFSSIPEAIEDIRQGKVGFA